MAFFLMNDLRFHFFGRLDVVRETQLGAARGALTFPGVNTCTTVTAICDGGAMAGVHLAMAGTERELLVFLPRMLMELGGAPVRHIVHAGGLTQTHPGGWDHRSPWGWPNQAAMFRAALGAPGAQSWAAILPQNTTVSFLLCAGRDGPELFSTPGEAEVMDPAQARRHPLTAL